jgi:hypothetical protein
VTHPSSSLVACLRHEFFQPAVKLDFPHHWLGTLWISWPITMWN